METKEQILNKWNEYKIGIQFTRQALNNLIDKQIMSFMEENEGDTCLKLVYNDFGAYLRSYQNGELECQIIRLKY